MPLRRPHFLRSCAVIVVDLLMQSILSKRLLWSPKMESKSPRLLVKNCVVAVLLDMMWLSSEVLVTGALGK